MARIAFLFRRVAVLAVAMCAWVAAVPAQASEATTLLARDTAVLRPKGAWSVGVFNPLAWAATDAVTLEAHPLLFAAAPHVGVRVAHARVAGWQLTGDYGLAVPSPSAWSGPPLGLAGYLFPSCKVAQAEPDRAPGSCQTPGWFLVPRAGLLASTGARHVWTLRAEVAAGIPLDDRPRQPLDAWAPVDLAFAPALNGWRARLGGRYDHAILDRLRGSAEVSLYATGNPSDIERSPWTAAAHVGLDLAVGAASRFTAGVMYWNSDQHAIAVEHVDGRWQNVRVRSHDFAPTVDFIWAN